MKKLLLSTLFLTTALTLLAQENQPKSFMDDPVNHPLAPLYLLLGLIVFVIFLILITGVAMIRVLNTMSAKAELERFQKEGRVHKQAQAFWARIIQRANASVPLEDEKSIELEHDYDGIRELDNHLPPWWKWTFYASIGFAIFYMAVYHFSDSLPLMDEEYQQELSIAEQQKKKLQAAKPKVEIDENGLVYQHDAGIIAKGKEIYTINCSPCHKNDGGGGIGPNLTDEYWLHGGDVKSIYATVKDGVPEKGMVSWNNVLSPEQLRDVSFFIVSLNGSNPPGAKGPQGEVVQAGSPDVQSDTVKARASL